jgi:tight adherence protein B
MVEVVAAVLLVVALRPPAVPAPAWLRRRIVPGRGRVRASTRRDAELEWVDALAAEVRAGRDPRTAFRAASATVTVPVAPSATAAAVGGGDVAESLRADARGSELLRGVAACWEVAEGSGAGLAASLAVLSDSARENARIRRELRTGMAEPRATAVVLALLPAVGILLGSALGADPLSWLFGTRPGNLVLAAGLALEGLGVLWAWRIAARLEAEL